MKSIHSDERNIAPNAATGEKGNDDHSCLTMSEVAVLLQNALSDGAGSGYADGAVKCGLDCGLKFLGKNPVTC